MFARPVDGFSGVRIETFEIFFGRTIFVVIAFDAGNIRKQRFACFSAHDIEAFFRIGVIADDVAETCHVRAFLRFNIFEHDVERLEIRVDVGNNCVLHSIPILPNNFKSAKFIFCICP